MYVHVLILINHYVQGVSLCYLYGHSLFVTIPPGISEKRVAKEFLPVLSGEGHYYKYGFIGRLIRLHHKMPALSETCLILIFINFSAHLCRK